MREHANRFETERRLAQSVARGAEDRKVLAAEAEARTAEVAAEAAAARQAEGAARQAVDEMGGKVRGLEAELGDARREVEALRSAAQKDKDRRDELEWRLGSLEAGRSLVQPRRGAVSASRPGTADGPQPGRAAAAAPDSTRGRPGSSSLVGRPSTPLINFVPPTSAALFAGAASEAGRESLARAAGGSAAGGSRCVSRPWSAIKAVAAAAESQQLCSSGSSALGSVAGSSPGTPHDQLGRRMVDGACGGSSSAEDRGGWSSAPPSIAATGRNSRPQPPAACGLQVRNEPGPCDDVRRLSACTGAAAPTSPAAVLPSPAAASIVSHWANDDFATAALYRPAGGALQKRYTQDQIASARKAAQELGEAAEAEQMALLGSDAGGVRGGAWAGAPRVRDDGNRVAYLSRQAVGHSPILGIQSAVRPTLHAASAEDVRAILCKLFVRQRQLSSQRALDNWELLALAAKLRPRQELLHRIRRSLQDSRGELLGGVSRTARPQSVAGRVTASQPSLGSRAGESHVPPLRPASRDAPGYVAIGAPAAHGGEPPSAAAAGRAGGADQALVEAIERRLGTIPTLLARNQQRFGFAAQVHSLRRDVFATVGQRLLNRTLHALVRLTDAVNTEPAFAVRNNSPSERAAAVQAFDPVDCDSDELARIVFAMPGAHAAHRAAASHRGGRQLHSAPVAGAPMAYTSAATPLSAAPALPFELSDALTSSWGAAHLAAIEVASRVGLAGGKSLGRPGTSAGQAHRTSPLHPASARRSRSPPRDVDSSPATGDTRFAGPGRRDASGLPGTVHGYLAEDPAWGGKAVGVAHRTPDSAGGASTPCGGARTSPIVDTARTDTPKMGMPRMDVPHEVSPRTVRAGSMRAAEPVADSRATRSSPRPPAAQPPRKGTAEAVALSAAFRSDMLRCGPGPTG